MTMVPETTSVTSRQGNVCVYVTLATGSVTAVLMVSMVSPSAGSVNVMVMQTHAIISREGVTVAVTTPGETNVKSKFKFF